MGDDASLDEFFDEAAGEETESGDEYSGGAAAHASVSVDPATTTYEFAPDGVACDSCGTTVDRRWHKGGALVCGECKDW